MLQSGGHLEYIILRPYIKHLISERKLRDLNIDVLLIIVSITDDSRLILHYIVILSFFHNGHFKNDPKWRIGPKISSVNTLILNHGGPTNTVIPLPALIFK